MPEFEILHWHCHGKPAHKAKKAHGKHGCTPAKKKNPRGVKEHPGLRAVKR